MLLALLLAAAPADTVRHAVSFPNAPHYEARIVADFRPGEGGALVFRQRGREAGQPQADGEFTGGDDSDGTARVRGQ